jgi:signal transduction histidine kinase
MCQRVAGVNLLGNVGVSAPRLDMAETNCSTGGSDQTTSQPRLAWRITMILLAALLALAWVVWIKEHTWRRLEQLRDEFGAIESERFLLGLHARESVVRLNGALLRYQLSGDGDEREKFGRVARELSERLAAVGPRLSTTNELRALDDFRKAYATYLAETAELSERPARGIRRDTAAQIHDIIVEKSRNVVRLAEELTIAQRAAWTDFFVGSREALESLQRMLWTSVVALLAFIALSTILIFRAVVLPLRLQLGESRATIAQQEKLASLGVLAAGVAHEIRNPLTAIKMRLFSLKRALPAAIQGNEDLAIIDSEINRLEGIVKGTLQFARPAEPQRGEVLVTEIFTDVRNLLGTQLMSRGNELRVEADEGLSFEADRQQIAQVLINLIQNAAESMSERGIITLRARTGAATLANRSQPVLILEVSDTGKGIPSEAEARIFDPFFSTKEGGTGLGLSIAARIVQQHGGTIQYSTQANRGTTFTIVLPKQLTDESANIADRG